MLKNRRFLNCKAFFQIFCTPMLISVISSPKACIQSVYGVDDNMIGNNMKKTTIWGGLFSALFLCALMALMPFSSVVAPASETDYTNESETAEEKADPFFLPEQLEPVDWEYGLENELEGMRNWNQKAFVHDGEVKLLTSSDPIHYADNGVWKEIDVNIKANANGWEVTENAFETYFPADVGAGVTIHLDPNVDPLVTGIAPQVVTMDESGVNPMVHRVAPSHDAISVGGNVIRYPVAQDFDLDYEVSSTGVKQDLIIRAQPVVEEIDHWFGLREIMRLPAGYALFIGDEMVEHEILTTQEPMSIRSLETGSQLGEIPPPVVIEPGAEAPYIATFFVSVENGLISITTAVETSWLMDENRTFPLSLDPSIKQTSNAGGYCYIYYGYCYSSSYRYMYRYYGTLYYLPWSQYKFNSNNQLPSGATAGTVKWKQYMQYSNTWGSNSHTVAIMKKCGTDVRYNYQVTSSSCTSTSMGSSDLGTGYGSSKALKMISSQWNSPGVGTQGLGTGWKSATLSTSGASDVVSALNSNGVIGMTYRNTNSNYYYTYANHGGTNNGYLEISYTGGSDTAPPTSEFIPYEVTSYKEGARTFFTTLKDGAGIDTTSSGKPHLYYSINGGSYTSVGATSIGSCSSSATECRFKATTASISAGDSVDYFWAYQDLAQTAGMNQNGNNFATDPAGGTGSPSSASAPSSPYNFEVEDVVNAGNDKKFVVLTTDVYAGSNYNPSKFFDRQMTYYDNSDEFVFEFDTSNCGTGYSNSCFYASTSSTNFYSNWVTQWTTSPSSGYNGFGGTRSGKSLQHKDLGGYLTISAQNGPSMNLIYHYDSSSNDWGLVGLDTSTGIDEVLTGGDTKSHRSTYGYTKAWNIKLDNIYGTVGKFDFNGTYSSSRSNWMCVGTNGFYYFFRSTSSNPGCSSGYYYIYSNSYRWTGFALNAGYYGRMASSGDMSYKVSKVAPEPDLSKPNVIHNVMKDSHSTKRTFAFKISDAGEPPSGLNTSSAAGVGPTLYYTITDADGTVGTQQTKVLSPDDTRSNCVLNACTWSATLSDLERESSLSYYIKTQDLSTVASGANVNQTSANSFEVAWPKKVFIVEWHDLGYNDQYTCNVQARLYDTTNEIEFHYDPDCEVYYDYATVGYQDQTRSKGDTLRNDLGYMGNTAKGVGGNPHDVNYRIFTDSSSHGSEEFDTGGFTELTNYKTAITGTSNGRPYLYYCSSAYYWNTYKANCDANIDMPDDFTFEYFGTTYNGTVSTNKVMLSRFAGMYFKQTSSTAPERAMTTWYSNMPDLPYSTNAAARPGLIAPWWGGYSAYYCYDSSTVDCSVRYRTMPFEGRGTDIDADITQDTSWDIIDSPIRINPSGDYLAVNANLNIEEGVVIQVAQGKGISFDGSCDKMTLQGNPGTNSTTGDSRGILFEGQFGQTWKGISFTGSCSSAAGTDDRHVFNHTTFANTTDYAISAGSRHGSSPSSNSNVGNFTMRDVAFKNVGGAISHGSGQGTAFAISNFEVSDASDSCFSFPAGSDVSLTEGEMDGCNSGNDASGGAVTSDSGSGGSLFMENVTITDAQKNVVNTELSDVTLRNVSASWSGITNGDYDIRHTGTGHLELTNFDSDDYPNFESNAMTFALDDVDVESSISLYPGGSSSTANGPSGLDASLSDVSTNGLSVARSAIAGSDIDLNGGDLSISGNSPSADQQSITDLQAGGIGISGCGYSIALTNVDLSDTSDTAYVSSSCGSSSAPNTLVVNDGTIATGTSSNNIVYARNSKITIGDTAITGMTSFGNSVARSSTNGIITLIDVTWNGDDCTDSDGSWAGASTCWVAISSNSGQINFGGSGTAVTFKEKSGARTNKGGIAVSTYALNAAGTASSYYLGTQTSDGNGEAEVWIVTTELSGSSLTSQAISGVYFDASGPAGINSTLNATFGIGDTAYLRLSQPPIVLSDSGMDCAYLAANDSIKDKDEAPDGQPAGTFVLDDGSIQILADLHIDGCAIKLMEQSKFIVSGDATSSPVLTISNGGSLILESGSELRAGVAAYPVHLDIGNGGTLSLDASFVKQIRQDSSAGGAIIVGKGATLEMINGSVAYGDSASSKDMATIMVDGGTFAADDSSVVNNGGTGTGVWFQRTTTAVTDLTVSGAARGIMSKNAAPSVNGFTLTNNDVGIEFEGGMSLPSIYRSTLLSGEATGWTTHAIDLSGQVDSGEQYLQVGFNSIFGGGNAHPRYTYYTSKYYMLYDRMRYEITLDDGTKFNYSYDQAGKDSAGYWSDTSSDNSDYSGWGRYDCNYYGYSRNPAYSEYNYMYYLARYASHYGSNGYYDYPDDFGFRWEDGGDISAGTMYYPYHYWGYYYNNYHAMYSSTYAPPEGFSGLFGNYNICIDYAYNNAYYITPGKGARMAMPIIDLQNTGTNSGTSGNIDTVTLYVDVLHNRADYYQDRFDILARTSDDHNVMGDWQRESGTPSFTDGTITGADVGIEISGSAAAGDVEDVTVSSPTTSGLEVTGSSAMSFDGLTVNGGENGVKVTYTGRGKVNLNNIALNNQNNAGILFQKDVSGELSGTITGSAGPAIEYGWLTNTDRSFENLDLSGNAIGIETAGSGNIELLDSDFANTVDFKITGSSTVDFVDGTVDESTVSVSGAGIFKRARSLEVTITADSNSVGTGADVYLLDSAYKMTGSGVTDSSGVAQGLKYFTALVDKAGLTNPSLSGYKLGTVAQIGTYSGTTGDFRYYYDSVTLDANAASSESVDLVERFDARVCYSFSSTSYTMIAQCSSSGSYLSTSGSRTLSCGTGCTMKEYGYYGGVVSDMSNMNIMVDVPFMYIDGGSNNKNQWNNSVVIMTGSYSYYGGTAWRATYPYNAKLYVDGSDFIAMNGMQDNGQPNGYQLGYYSWSDVNPWYKNSNFIGVSTIAAANENGNWMPDHFVVVNNTIVSNTRVIPGITALTNAEYCVHNGGVNDAEITDNTFYDCAVSVRAWRGNTWGISSSNWGADDMLIEDNEFNGGVIDIWFALSSYTDDTIIRGNTHTGPGISNYAVYAQDQQTTGTLIEGNTIDNSEEPIYLRGALDFEIKDNSISGLANAAEAGIYVRNGYGEIDGNTLVDADGGILVDGIKFGFDVSVTDNTISSSPDRTAISAVGIWAEDCGSSTFTSGGNTITVMGNAIVADGCDIEDTGSSLIGTGGTGSMVYTVNMMATYFSPQNITITEGDSIRWRLKEYASGSNYQHSSVSNDTASGAPLWDSGALNLGSTYTRQFNTAGTYDYHCGQHPSSMFGTITVQAAGSGSSTYYSTGFDVAGGNDDIVLNGTSITGFTTAFEQTGGSLSLMGNALLSADDYGADLDNVDVSSNGASLVTTSATGVGMYFTGGGSLNLVDLSTDSARGVHIDGETDGDFDWNGGTISSGTGLYAEDKAVGDIQNMTWSDADVQVHAGDNTKITSVGNTLDPSKMSVSSTGEVYEANLLDLDVTHSNSAISNVGLLIQSEGGSNVAYVSPDMRSDAISVATAGDSGDLSDWTGNEKNPADDARPGVVSSDGAGEDFMVTWDQTNLYLALTGVDMGAGDLLIFIDSASQGSTSGWEWDGTTPTFNHAADYAFFAENGEDSPNDGDSTYTWGLRKYSDPNWVADSCQNMQAFIGWSDNTNSEVKIPWSCIGSPSDGDKVRLSAVVLGESDGSVASSHPSTGHVKLTLGQTSLSDGMLDDKRLNYREFIGSTTPSAADEYTVTVKVDAPDGCEDDWGVLPDLDMSQNRDESIDILRACPVISGITDVEYDEDSGAHTISLTDKAGDLQDAAADLTWTFADDYSTNEASLLSVSLSGHELTITPADNQFGTYLIDLTVEDSHGLTDSETFMVTVNNVNDKPIICNSARSDCMLVFSDDGFDNLNILDEGWVEHKKTLGSTISSPFITDQYNEQNQTLANSEDVPQIYTWGATVDDDCVAFTVEVLMNELWINENMQNELGGVCTITMTLTDGASVNDAADAVDVTFTINPVNDVPVIPVYDVSGDSHITDGTGASIATPWSVTVSEDTGCDDGECVNTDELTFNLANMKEDNDHNDEDLSWTWEEISSSCDVDKYFESIEIVGDNIEFTLIQDATTNAPPEEKDYLDDNGIHQEPPPSMDEFCAIKLTLSDTATAPSYIPNYGLASASYKQESTEKLFKIRVDNTPELVADYLFDVDEGIDFNSVQFIMPGTNVPVDVTVKHEGDEGPYKYDQLLKVSFLSDGADGLTVRDTYYVEPPAYGKSGEFTSKVLIEETTTRVGARVDVMTCKAEACPSPSAATPSDFISNVPPAHQAEETLSPWSSPGTVGYSSAGEVYSQRRPALEDKDWLNNVMFTSTIDSDPEGILDSGQELPVMVDTISPASVPSFAPGFAAISAAGLFVAGLMLASSRRRMDEEELEALSMVDDEQAVSPVIATILMVAITVVLSGVVYVWASDLADQPSKSVPRIGFKVEKVDPGTNGYWSIQVISAKEPIATQATVAMVEWVNASGSQIESFRLDNTEGVYGFAPLNSESFVTFSDSIVCDSATECTSTFGDGDAIHISMTDSSGELLTEGVRVTLKYMPVGLGTASVLKTFNLEI